MKFELILGCMFSGKSSELIRRIRMHRLMGRKILVINHTLDTRYGSCLKVTSHDMVEETAISCTTLAQVYDIPEYNTISAIFIDEGQFFEDLDTFVKRAVEEDGKTVVVSALDGNYKREPYPHVINLIPFADHVLRLNALCSICKDGTLATFSKRIRNTDQSSTFVGGSDSYMSVCRKHYTNP